MTANREDRFHELAEVVYEPLQRFIRRRLAVSDAEEVFDDVLVTIWRRLDDVPPNGALPWCYGVARRAVANRQRGNRRRLALIERIAAQPVPEPLDPTGTADDPALADALAALSEADRQLLMLWAWEGLEPRDMAVVLGISANAAALRLSRARQKLADRMMRQDRVAAGHRGVKDTGGRR